MRDKDRMIANAPT